ncbi:MAG: aspartate-semialdehyde dehydrogenase [Cuniculiplasma sp. C_DKE]|nr:MAG: aspartate-semialdehyde dehydrogenase [Cuniculiplasma sp. C_DKE]
MDKLSVGVLGCTGLVGETFLKLLENHPWFRVDGIYASKNSAGLLMKAGSIETNELTVKDSTVENIVNAKHDIVFSAISDLNAGPIELELSKHGQWVFTNASANRLNAAIPLVVPEINSDHLNMINEDDGFIVANGNCSTIGLSLGIDPIFDLMPQHLTVTTLQSISGAGYPGIPSMDILGNVIPFINGEEGKLEKETKKIFGKISNGKMHESSLNISATATRVPVKIGHIISATVEVREDVDEKLVLNKIKNYGNGSLKGQFPTLPKESIMFVPGNDRPQPLLDSNSDDVLKEMQVKVGRIRVSGKYISLIILVNNLVRGAAGASILNAEIVSKMRRAIS